MAHPAGQFGTMRQTPAQDDICVYSGTKRVSLDA
jgi:hypothetical protein